MSNAVGIPIPPAPPNNLNENKLSTKLNANAPAVLFDKCLWAEKWPELQKACYLARICQNEPPKKCHFRTISSQLQVGPTCGLTALSMLLDGIPAPDDILQIAKNLNYTKNGELFSAQNLYELVDKYFIQENQNNERTCELYESILDCNYIRKNLLEGVCIFVPYPFYKRTNFLN